MGLKESGLRGSLRNVSVGIDAIPDSEDLHAHYDATTISASDGDSISTWSDQTDNDHDLTAGAEPIYKTDILNGNPIVRFDGVDDFLNVSFSEQSQPNTIFVVFQLNSVESSRNNHIIDANTGNNQAFFTDDSNDQNYQLFAGNRIGGNTQSAPPETYIASNLFNETSSEFRLNGTTDSTGDVGINNLDGITVGAQGGGDNNTEVDIGEILVYPSDKSQIFNDVESYLNDKWGVF